MNLDDVDKSTPFGVKMRHCGASIHVLSRCSLVFFVQDDNQDSQDLGVDKVLNFCLYVFLLLFKIPSLLTNRHSVTFNPLRSNSDLSQTSHCNINVYPLVRG